jgi:hypothetical protein
MRSRIPSPDGLSVIELDARPNLCVVDECGGAIVRHSLGGGQSIDRCTRCFRRYQVRASAIEDRGRWQRLLDDFVAWRE